MQVRIESLSQGLEGMSRTSVIRVDTLYVRATSCRHMKYMSLNLYDYPYQIANNIMYYIIFKFNQN